MPSTSGALSNILIKSANSIRSSHPTNSYIGFGSRAEQILMQHDETKGHIRSLKIYYYLIQNTL